MIKNLLFDLGGVIMDIDKERCVKAFEELGLPDAANYFGEYCQKEPFSTLESGHLTIKEFHETVQSLIPVPVTNAQIDAAFDKFLIGIPVKRLEQLRELRKRYNLYLLSNTNPIMWKGFIAGEFSKEGLSMRDYFDGMTTSFDAKSLKPDAKIFEYASRTMEINPEETLFLDDSKANCEAARALGWHAAHVAPGCEFSDIITQYISSCNADK